MRTNWLKNVTERRNSLDLDSDVFTLDDPKAIARSLKRSADRSHRRKSSPYRSKSLPKRRLKVFEAAKDERRAAFGR